MLAQSPSYFVVCETRLRDSPVMRIFLPQPGPMFMQWQPRPLKTNEGFPDGSPLCSVGVTYSQEGRRNNSFPLTSHPRTLFRVSQVHVSLRGTERKGICCLQGDVVTFALDFSSCEASGFPSCFILMLFLWVTGENALKANYFDKFWVWLMHILWPTKKMGEKVVLDFFLVLVTSYRNPYSFFHLNTPPSSSRIL